MCICDKIIEYLMLKISSHRKYLVLFVYLKIVAIVTELTCPPFQLTPIERYAMNFLEASLEDVCKEELKQAEVTTTTITTTGLPCVL